MEKNLLEHIRDDFVSEQELLRHTAQSPTQDYRFATRCGITNVWIDRQRPSESGDWALTKPLDTGPTVDSRFFATYRLAEAVVAEDTM